MELRDKGTDMHSKYVLLFASLNSIVNLPPFPLSLFPLSSITSATRRWS